MGGTVVGQYSGVGSTRKDWCNYCEKWKEFCFALYDYCPAGSDSQKFAFCGSCLEYMSKKVEEKKAETKKKARAEKRKKAKAKAKRAGKVRLKK
jgi:hypothetical protein